jgi:cytidine deaminase
MMKEFSFQYTTLNSYTELGSEDLNLVERAFNACGKAYAPYSKFHVGASVLLENGEIVEGNNQENIAYPSGLCAERVTLFWVGANFPNTKVLTLAIVAKGDLLPVDQILSPCGGCRQVMLETELRQVVPYRIIIVSQNNRTMIFNSAKDLLPFSFGSM